MRRTSHQKFMSKNSNSEKYKSTLAEGNSSSHVQTDRSNNRDSSFLVLGALDYFSKKIRMREVAMRLRRSETPLTSREGTPSQKMYFLRHLKLPNAKQLRRRTMSRASQAISFTIITLHLAVRCTCPANRRSRYLSSVLTQFGRQTQIWIFWKGTALTIIDTLSGNKTPLGRLDEVSLDLAFFFFSENVHRKVTGG